MFKFKVLLVSEFVFLRMSSTDRFAAFNRAVSGEQQKICLAACGCFVGDVSSHCSKHLFVVCTEHRHVHAKSPACVDGGKRVNFSE